MGAVFKAHQPSLDRVVALKVLPPSIAEDKTFIERFQREARASARLNHPNIVQGIDVGKDEASGLWFFAMEFVDGPTAKEIVEKDGPIPEDRALKITRDVAEALVCAERSGIVHRDIKPDNILISSRGETKLADMGLAKQTHDDAGLTQAGQAVGTPHYMAPEQAKGLTDEIDIRTDLYGLGATLFSMLTGKPPFEGRSAAEIMAKHLNEKVPAAHRVSSDVSEVTGRLIAQLMQKAPQQRIQTPADLIERIDQILALPKDETGRRRVAGATTGRLRPVAGRSSTRTRLAGLDTSKQEKPKGSHGIPILLGLIGCALIALLAAVLSRGGSDSRPQSKKKESKVVAKTQTNDQTQPEVKEVEKTEEKTEALPIVDKMQEKAAAALKGLKAQVEKLANEDNYDEALGLLSNPPAEFSAAPRADRSQMANGLKSEAQNLFNAAKMRAEQLSKDGSPTGGLAELKKIASMKYAPIAKQREALRLRLEKRKAELEASAKQRQEAAAHAALNKMLDSFDNALTSQSFDEAEKIVSDFRNRGGPHIQRLTAELVAADTIATNAKRMVKQRKESIAALIGKKLTLTKKDGRRIKGVVKEMAKRTVVIESTFRIGTSTGSTVQKVPLADIEDKDRARFQPGYASDNPDGHMAAAVLSMSEGRFDAADTSLAAAGNHPLGPRYRERLAELRRKAADDVARSAWEKDISLLVRDTYSLKDAKKLVTALDNFARDHGKTEFGEGRIEEIARLRVPADKAIEESPEGMIAKLKKLYRGKVVRFDTRTSEIELFYDFETPNQIEDWSVSSWFYQQRSSGALKVEDGVLRNTLHYRFAALRGVFTSASVQAVGSIRGGAKQHISVVVCANPARAFYNAAAMQNTVFVARTIGNHGKRLLVKPLATPFNQRPALSLDFANGKLRAQVAGVDLSFEDKTLSSGQVGVFAYQTDADFKEFRVRGQLDRAWLTSALKKQRLRERIPLYKAWPFDAKEAKRRQQETAKVLEIPVEPVVDLGGGIAFKLCLIPAGEFEMGASQPADVIVKRSPGTTISALSRQRPKHRVRITMPYYMGKHEVTQDVWTKIMGTNASRFKGARKPMDSVSWTTSLAFARKLTKACGRKWVFSLPTEAEWEHACRAGTATSFFFGDKITSKLANYDARKPWNGITGEYRGGTTPVGDFPPNAWGLHDVCGNVFEWVVDSYTKYRKDPQIDPLSPPKASPYRVCRGGCWSYLPGYCMSSTRAYNAPASASYVHGVRIKAAIFVDK